STEARQQVSIRVVRARCADRISHLCRVSAAMKERGPSMVRLQTAASKILPGLLTLLLFLAQTSCCCPQCPPPSSVTQAPDTACQPAASERRDCQEFSPGGWGPHNHKFLEGRGLEQIYFQSQPGATVPFPPPAGMLLTAASECGNARLTVKVASCLPDNR